MLAASFVPWASSATSWRCGARPAAAWRRRWGRVRTSLLVFCCSASSVSVCTRWWLAPAYVGHPRGAKPDLVVVEANLHMGRADPADTASVLRRARRPGGADRGDAPALLRSRRGAVGSGQRRCRTWPVTPCPAACGRRGRSRFTAVGGADAADHPLGYLLGSTRRTRSRAAVHTAQPAIDIDAWRRDRDGRAPGAPLRGPTSSSATSTRRSTTRRCGTCWPRVVRRGPARPTPAGSRPGRARNGRECAGSAAPFGLFAIDHVLISSHFAVGLDEHRRGARHRSPGAGGPTRPAR